MNFILNQSGVKRALTLSLRNGMQQALQLLIGLLTRLPVWEERARQRRQLLRLDDHLLKDMGMSRADAYREAHKPFWRD